MTLVVIGPATKDLIIKENEKESKVGGATFFQSFVYEALNIDYLAIVNLSDKSIINEFPDTDKVIAVLKEDTHFFLNNYPNKDNLDIRYQSSNFADIPILADDLKPILKNIDNIDAFVLNPLNSYDFPLPTLNYLKKFKVPIYMSIQGLLRKKDISHKEDGLFEILLDKNQDMHKLLENITSIFLDENEFKILFEDNNTKLFNLDEIVVTDGSKGSRIINPIDNRETDIDAVYQKNIVDSTGCGDTYMAAYISRKLTAENSIEAGKFASLISSKKLSCNGPYKPL